MCLAQNIENDHSIDKNKSLENYFFYSTAMIFVIAKKQINNYIIVSNVSCTSILPADKSILS